MLKELTFRDFSGSAVVKTLHVQCKGFRFDPCLGNYDPTGCRACLKKKEKKKKTNHSLTFREYMH